MVVLNLHRVRVFHAVARRESYSRAAEDLHISQPAVSKHVLDLEEELGTKLFHRLGRRIVLTEAGRLMADYAQRIFVLADEARRALEELQGLERGRLHLGASSTPGNYLLPRALAAFQARYHRLELSLDIMASHDVVDRVIRQELDLGFVGATFAADLHVQPYMEDELVLILRPGHPLASVRTIPHEVLQKETFVLRDVASGTRTVAEAELKALGITIRRFLELRSVEAIKQAVAEGLGISFISRYAVALEVRHKVLAVAADPRLRFRRPLVMISRKDARISPAALAFAATLQKLT
ncbi:MAG: LysR family transcriptional regulator [candidate division NC10 bacterium]|nr:LysR family transcriptional regulator [candidate division NC10 bacterium]